MVFYHRNAAQPVICKDDSSAGIAPLRGAGETKMMQLQELRSSGAERQKHHFPTRIQECGCVCKLYLGRVSAFSPQRGVILVARKSESPAPRRGAILTI